MDVDLPPSRNIRWVAWRKAAVVAAVRYSQITMAEALHFYQLSEEEFLSWQRAFESQGLRGLRATCIQEYREPRRQREKNGARVTSILPVQLNHHQRRMPPPSPTNHNREITKNSKQRDDEASPVHGGADADACCVRGFDRSPSFHCVSPRPFNRRLASASPRSRARRYQKRASVGSLLAPRKTSQPRKAGWKVAPSRSAAWPSPALAARS